MDKKKLGGKLATTSEFLKKILKELKKFLKVPKKESVEQKVTRELEVTATKVKATEASAVHAIAIGACYDLFCQLLADDPQVQWDHIVREVHNTDRGSGPFVPSIFLYSGAPLFFLFWRECKHQKTDRRRTNRVRFFAKMIIAPPPHCCNFTIDLQ
jgi:hypothetical protein